MRHLLITTAALAVMSATPAWAVTYDCNLIDAKGNTLTYSFRALSKEADQLSGVMTEVVFQKNGLSIPPRTASPSWRWLDIAPGDPGHHVKIIQNLDPSYHMYVNWMTGNAYAEASLSHDDRTIAHGRCTFSGPPTTVASYQPTAPAPTAPAPSVASSAIPIMWSGGSWVVDAKFGSMVRTMVLDTGATVITLNKSTADALVASGEAEWLSGTAESTLADGRTVKSSAIRIHDVQIGSYRKSDVPAMVNGDDNGTELFGVTFLNTSGRFTVDAKNHQLILG